MEVPNAGHDLQNIVVRPVYLRAVNAIVQPEQQIPCTLYFFREWLPRLGSLRWALVLALRHLCTLRQPDGVSRGEVSRAQLAAILGVHEVTISRVLATTRSPTQPGWRVLQPAGDDDVGTKLLAKFIPRLRYKYDRDPSTGSTRRVGYIIDVVMDDPLVPEDEHKLALVLAQQILAGGDYQTPSAEVAGTALDPSARKITQVNRNYQNATSRAKVKSHNVATPADRSLQNATSPLPVTEHLAPSAGMKEQCEPALTLTNNFNYHGLTVPLNLSQRQLIRRAVTPLVDHARKVLRDDHSTGMFYSTLTQLYPNHLHLFVEALERAAAAGVGNPDLNLGAVFVNTLKALAWEQGFNLRLGLPGGCSTPPEDQDESEPREQPDDEPAEAAEPERHSVYIAEVGMSTMQVWQSVLEELKHRTSRANYEMWLKNCYIVAVRDGEAIIGAPNRFTRDWVSEKLRSTLSAAMSRVLGMPVAVRCEVAGEVGDSIVAENE